MKDFAGQEIVVEGYKAVIQNYYEKDKMFTVLYENGEYGDVSPEKLIENGEMKKLLQKLFPYFNESEIDSFVESKRQEVAGLKLPR